MSVSDCPNCGYQVNLGEGPEIGLKLFCDSCFADLVVVWLNPIELMVNDYEEYGQFDGDYFGENIQKIRKKGDKDGSWKIQEKHKENHRYKKDQ